MLNILRRPQFSHSSPRRRSDCSVTVAAHRKSKTLSGGELSNLGTKRRTATAIRRSNHSMARTSCRRRVFRLCSDHACRTKNSVALLAKVTGNVLGWDQQLQANCRQLSSGRSLGLSLERLTPNSRFGRQMRRLAASKSDKAPLARDGRRLWSYRTWRTSESNSSVWSQTDWVPDCPECSRRLRSPVPMMVFARFVRKPKGFPWELG